MCRPPDLTPTAGGGFAGEDGLDYVEGVDDANYEYEIAGSDAPGTTLLGKRDLLEEARLVDATSRAAKLPRAAPPVSSAFDSAAASFITRMEQSMLQDLQRQQLQQQQQQRLLAAAAVRDTENALLHQALAHQQRTKQLQQLHLLKQLQQKQQQQQQQQLQVLPEQQQQLQVLPEQQQLLLAQQALLQQSQTKLLDALTPAPSVAATPDATWATLLKQQQQQQQQQLKAAAAVPTPVTPTWSADAKIQAWMQNGLLPGGSTPSSSVLPTKTLPAIHPKPAVPTAAAAAAAVLAAAKAGVDINSSAAAAVMLGLGSLGQTSLHCASMGVVGEEKKAKRMQSNRASAKRSRQRRQARLEELDKATATLIDENTSMNDELEEAQKEIMSLEEKNRSLVQEVIQLRKMLGMEVESLAPKAGKGSKSEAAVSGAEHQSCIESEGCNPAAVASANAVKCEAESEIALANLDKEDASEEVEEGAEGAEENKGSLDWLADLPLSPGALSPAPGSPLGAFLSSEDQLLAQGDVFSELLACLEA